ncbi:MAG TPA: hypothetical protein VL625_05175, partial [Patescibacteria group bacterium]|nr:hypothetical protein [Patescibacteria group bacterium]
GLSYAAATMQLMAWDMQLKAGKINGEQIAPHLDSLENYISDDVLTSEEITAWINELKAAGLVKAKE